MMNSWKRIKNYLVDLYYWRTERRLIMEENDKLRGMVAEAQRDAAMKIEGYEQLYQKQDECISALAVENEHLVRNLGEMEDQLLHLHDLNECLWSDWGVKHNEWAIATKKLQKKDDGQYRLWVEHNLLLATMQITDPKEAERFYVEE